MWLHKMIAKYVVTCTCTSNIDLFKSNNLKGTDQGPYKLLHGGRILITYVYTYNKLLVSLSLYLRFPPRMICLYIQYILNKKLLCSCPPYLKLKPAFKWAAPMYVIWKHYPPPPPPRPYVVMYCTIQYNTIPSLGKVCTSVNYLSWAPIQKQTHPSSKQGPPRTDFFLVEMNFAIIILYHWAISFRKTISESITFYKYFSIVRT